MQSAQSKTEVICEKMAKPHFVNCMLWNIFWWIFGRVNPFFFGG